MNDNDIVKALEAIASADIGDCKRDCAFYDGKVHFCGGIVAKHSLDLIERQKAEILELQGNRKFIRGTVARLLETSDKQQAMIEKLKEAYAVYEETTGLKQVRAEAIKEFAERLKATPYRFREERTIYFDKPPITKMVLFVDDNDIDNLVKEMTEGQP